MTTDSKSKTPASFSETAHHKTNADLTPENARYASIQAINPAADDAIEKIIQLMGDPSWRVRKASVEKIASFEHTADLIATLTEALSADNNARLRNTAAEALVEIGSGSLEHLVVALGTADSSRRKFIVEILGSIGTDTARVSLFAALNDRDRNVQAAVVEALGSIGGRAVVSELVRRASEAQGDKQLLNYLVGALGTCKAEVDFTILEAWEQERSIVRLVGPLLGLSGDPRAFPLLAKHMMDGSRSVRTGALRGVRHAMEVFAPLDLSDLKKEMFKKPEVLERIREALGDKDPSIAESAFDILVMIGDPEFASDILRAGTGEAWEPRAVEAVVNMGPQVVEPLMREFSTTRASARVLFLEVLELLGDDSVIPTLVRTAHGGDSRAAEAAIHALARIGGQTEVDVIVELIVTGESDLKQPATLALSAIGKRHPQRVADQVRMMIERKGQNAVWLSVLGALRRSKDLDVVVEGVRNANPKIRKAALGASLSYGGSFPEEVLLEALNDAVATVRAAAARALGAFSTDQALVALRQAMEDDDPWVVSEVVEALGRSGAHLVVDELFRMVEHESPAVAISSLQALARLCPVGVVGIIDVALQHQDSEVVVEAMNVLRCLSRDEAGERLLKSMEHPSWDVRLAAAEMAQRRRIVIEKETLVRLLKEEREVIVRAAFEELESLVEAGE